VRHDLVYRNLVVREVQRVTPCMLRITLAGRELDGFSSPAFDDHVKVFFPETGQARPTLPVAGPNGPMPPAHGMVSPCRSYTPRRFDPDARELDIDMMLHGAGVADSWVRGATPGHILGIGGPRRSHVVPDVDWQLLMGDETAIPAVSRRLAELPAHSRAHVVLEVADPTERQPLPTVANVDIVWRFRGGAAPGTTSALLGAVRDLSLPEGSRYFWGAGESREMRAIRNHLTRERNVDPAWIRVTGYWTRGVANHVE
jgi:NADPH-dependent ferric siderophore reductase